MAEQSRVLGGILPVETSLWEFRRSSDFELVPTAGVGAFINLCIYLQRSNDCLAMGAGNSLVLTPNIKGFI